MLFQFDVTEIHLAYAPEDSSDGTGADESILDSLTLTLTQPSGELHFGGLPIHVTNVSGIASATFTDGTGFSNGVLTGDFIPIVTCCGHISFSPRAGSYFTDINDTGVSMTGQSGVWTGSYAPGLLHSLFTGQWVSATTVPEPGSLFLVLLGALLVRALTGANPRVVSRDVHRAPETA